MNAIIRTKLIEFEEENINQAHSDLIPDEFLHNEIKRKINGNYEIIRDEERANEFIERISPQMLEYYKKELEGEYECYFKTEEFLIKRKQFNFNMWKSVFAGSNAQIERILIQEGLDSLLEGLGFYKKPSEIKREIDTKEVKSEFLKKYLIQIGYFFPSKNKLIIHPNLFFSLDGHSYTGDSTFLTRDMIRCPYHEWGSIDYKDSWRYWKDLLAFSLGQVEEYWFYHSENFYGKEKLDEEHKKILEIGRKLTPKRYTSLIPEIEKFDWI